MFSLVVFFFFSFNEGRENVIKRLIFYYFNRDIETLRKESNILFKLKVISYFKHDNCFLSHIVNMFSMSNFKIRNDLNWITPIMTAVIAIAAEPVARSAATARSWWMLVATEVRTAFLFIPGDQSMVKVRTLLLAFRFNEKSNLVWITAFPTHRWHQLQHSTQHHG